jgi:hypothetical protein
MEEGDIVNLRRDNANLLLIFPCWISRWWERPNRIISPRPAEKWRWSLLAEDPLEAGAAIAGLAGSKRLEITRVITTMVPELIMFGCCG